MWTAWTWLFVATLAGIIAYALWREPYPIHEVNAFVSEASFLSPLQAFWQNLTHPALVRPLHWGMLSLVLHVFGNTQTSMVVFEVLHLLSVVCLLTWIVYFLRPTSRTGFLSAATALACFVGMPSFRASLENLPLNTAFMILPLGFVCVSLLRGPYRKINDVVVALLCMLAVLIKEQGMIVPVIVIAGFMVGFRGLSRVGLACTVLVLLAYLGYRIATVGGLPMFYMEASVFFTAYSVQELRETFGHNPFPIYLYNVLATAMNTLCSEPTRGQFVVTQALLEGRAPFWQVCAVGVSLASTVLIFSWGLQRTIQTWRGTPSDEWRLFVMFVAALGVSSVVGFNFTRDRFGGVVGGFYALSLAFALNWALNALFMAKRGGLSFWVGVVSLALITSLWPMRAAATVATVRQMAWDNRKEWIYDFDRKLAESTEKGQDLKIYTLWLYRDQGLDPTVASIDGDPRWVDYYFGYKP